MCKIYYFGGVVGNGGAFAGTVGIGGMNGGTAGGFSCAGEFPFDLIEVSVNVLYI
jgi:hypothetical protein